MRTPDGCGDSGESLLLQAVAHTASPRLLAFQAGFPGCHSISLAIACASQTCSPTVFRDWQPICSAAKPV